MCCSSVPCKYDVFLSFHGEDTRKNFTSHLHAALYQKGIKTFKNDEEIDFQAIQESRICIVIFSTNYGASTWCLDQLVKIYDCKLEQTVLPVFYKVDPSEVRKQTGNFGTSFANYEHSFKHRVQRWRIAATHFANLSGWDLQNRHESELIEEIVEEVLKKLRKSSPKFSSKSKNFTGINSRLEEMMNLCLGHEEQLDGVEFLGICGMGGIGKTTIARAIFAELSTQFEGTCFLANVREVEEKYGLIALQEQLLSEIFMERSYKIWNTHGGINEIRNRLRHKKVLIILDDVNRLDQLKSLAGMQDWFGNGSRIIITTRDEHLLLCHGVEKIYRAQGLDHEEAFNLFCFKAFKDDYPPYDYIQLSHHFVNYANGLPLALDVLGSFLFDKSAYEWESALDRLKEIPNKKILDKLYISFDGLEEVEKKIFLDIACFFKGEDKDYVIRTLESCGFYADIGIKVLLSKSLITISNGRIWMHDLLEEMGREIVRRSSYEEPGKRSRLWKYKDIYHVLSNDTGSEEVEGIVVDSCEEEEEDDDLSANAFTKMRKLRLLKLRNLQFSGEINYLSSKLRYLDWDRYPFKSLPSSFQPDKLVELHLQSSNIQQLWKGIKPLKMLKVIDLSYSANLIKTIHFAEVPNLEKLNLEGCTRLIGIHKSIGILKRLIQLNLKDCKALAKLPSSICDLKSLKVLNLQGCSRLDEIPERLGEMSCLEKVDLAGIGATQVTTSAKPWDFLLLSWLMPKKNPNLMAFVPSLSVLCSLRSLNLSYCNLTEEVLPKDLSCFPLLQTLNLSGNNIVSLPKSIIGLSKLEDFRVDNCKRLNSLPNLPSSILYLSTVGCSSLATSLPNTISRHYEQKNLCFPDCERLHSLPDLSSVVVRLSIEGLTAQETLPNSDSEHSVLTFVNRIQLVEIESKTCSAFSRLVSYLHYLLKHSSQGLFNPNSHVSMCLAGNEVPEWFNYRGIGDSLRMQLPPHWYSNRWMGFAICAVLEAPLSISDTMLCDLQAWNYNVGEDEEVVLLGRPATQIPAEMGSVIMFNFMPRSSLNCGNNWWEKFGNLKASFHSNGLKVKHCGLRIIYDHDVGELIQCHRPAQELINVSDQKSKRNCCSSRDETDGFSPKRLKM